MKYIVQPVFECTQNYPGVEGGRSYVISSARSGLVARAKGSYVHQFRWTEDFRQCWLFTPLDGDDRGYFKINHERQSKVLGIQGIAVDVTEATSPANMMTAQVEALTLAAQHAGRDVAQETWADRDDQKWRIVYLGSSVFRVENKVGNLVLTISGGPDRALEEDRRLIVDKWEGEPRQQWLVREAAPLREPIFSRRAVFFEGPGYSGKRHELGPGFYPYSEIRAWNNKLSSLKVPVGLKVTVMDLGTPDPAHNLRMGASRSFYEDSPAIGSLNNRVSSVLIEPVVRLYEKPNFQGHSIALSQGGYDRENLARLPDNTVSSIKVPQGMAITVFESEDRRGKRRIHFDDIPRLDREWDNKISSAIVQPLGTPVPDAALRYGGSFALSPHKGGYLQARAGGSFALHDERKSSEMFTIYRAGSSKHASYVFFGDTVALKTGHDTWLALDDAGMIRHVEGEEPGPKSLVTIVRTGKSKHASFVAGGDEVSLFRAGRYLTLQSGVIHDSGLPHGMLVDRTWAITGYSGPPAEIPVPDDLAALGGGCGAAVCGAEACQADVCGAAACGAAASLISVCGAAASGIAICGADAAFVGACGAAACGVAAGGVSACGMDACGIAACGAAACGAAVTGIGACGADACGGAACGLDAVGAGGCGVAACGIAAESAGACLADACGADACAAEADLVGACQADACAANVCAINACPADACAADACALDVIPILPLI